MGYNSLAELFKATADAIRSKTGSTDPIVANDFPAAIAGISGGGGSTENGPQTVEFSRIRMQSGLYPVFEVEGLSAYQISEKLPPISGMRFYVLSYNKTLVDDEGDVGEWLTYHHQTIGDSAPNYGELGVYPDEAGVVCTINTPDESIMLLITHEPLPLSETVILPPGVYAAFQSTPPAFFAFSYGYSLL